MLSSWENLKRIIIFYSFDEFAVCILAASYIWHLFLRSPPRPAMTEGFPFIPVVALVVTHSDSIVTVGQDKVVLHIDGV